MKTLLLAVACAVLLTSPALACRGTAEYPEVAAQLTKAELPDEQKETLSKRLEEGEALHRTGHNTDDAEQRKESLKITTSSFNRWPPCSLRISIIRDRWPRSCQNLLVSKRCISPFS